MGSDWTRNCFLVGSRLGFLRVVNEFRSIAINEITDFRLLLWICEDEQHL